MSNSPARPLLAFRFRTCYYNAVGKITYVAADAIDQREGLYRTDRLVDRIASHHFALVFGNWITSAEREPSCVIHREIARRGDVELRYSMAAEIPAEASRRMATGTIGAGVVSADGSHYM